MYNVDTNLVLWTTVLPLLGFLPNIEGGDGEDYSITFVTTEVPIWGILVLLLLCFNAST